MRQTVVAATIAVLTSFVAVACDDDAPSTNTINGPPAGTAPGTDPAASGTASTRPSEGNVGDITGSTPVAAGDDDVVQENQPMLSSATD